MYQYGSGTYDHARHCRATTWFIQRANQFSSLFSPYGVCPYASLPRHAAYNDSYTVGKQQPYKTSRLSNGRTNRIQNSVTGNYITMRIQSTHQ